MKNKVAFEITAYIYRKELGVEPAFQFLAAVSTPEQASKCNELIWNLCIQCFGQPPVRVDWDYEKHRFDYWLHLPMFYKFGYGEYKIKEDKYKLFADLFTKYVKELEEDQLGYFKNREESIEAINQQILDKYLEEI